MAIIYEENSLEYITMYSPVRCDTHFKSNIKLADNFFNNPKINWVQLGSFLENVQNGMNIKTEFYSMEMTDIYYLSVSQIKEYGLIEKNQNYLIEDVRDLNNFVELNKDTIIITRSGTIGVALSTNHPSFNFNEKSYVASGFVISSTVKKGYSSDVIANYLNLFDVQRYVTAMASGACQKNISQPTIKSLPIPEILLTEENEFIGIFNEYESKSLQILHNIEEAENELTILKSDISSSVKNKLFDIYK